MSHETKLIDDRFQILSEEGRGGTAVLYLAFDSKEKRTVALKLFQSDRLDPAILNEFWFRELSALQQLDHENIVKFIAAGRCLSTEERYIAMEWFDGVPLEKELRARGKMTFSDFMSRYGSFLLGALCHAAEKNVFHRDLSPNNVLVSDSGIIKVIDFGLARLSSPKNKQTVAAYATPPYAPPERDSGFYTGTRDGYSFAALLVRAVSGRTIDSYEELYDELGRVSDELPEVVQIALSRDPAMRPKSIIEFNAGLNKDESSTDAGPRPYYLCYRVAPNILEDLKAFYINHEGRWEDNFRRDLNEGASVCELSDPGDTGNFLLETRGFRIVAGVDRNCAHASRVAFFGFTPRLVSYERLWRPSSWQAEFSFSDRRPNTSSGLRAAGQEIERFYRDFEEYFANRRMAETRTGNRLFDHWARFLEAQTSIERQRTPLLRYSKPEVEGTRLLVDVENPQDATPGEERIIYHDRRICFKGTIEAVKGNTVILNSATSRVDPESLPYESVLENDWSQSRAALKKQRAALDAFRKGEIVNRRLREIVSLADRGALEPSFVRPERFFSSSLDDDKKLVVSRFHGFNDVLVVQGPPGTGKTTLIVELIRQFLASNPGQKVLLASQTHVALDNAIGGVLGTPESGRVVRIGSGGYQPQGEIATCTVESRGQDLLARTKRASELYIREKAEQLEIDAAEVTQGMLISELLRLRELKERTEKDLFDREEELEHISKERSKPLKTVQVDELNARADSLEAEIFDYRAILERIRAETDVAEARLRAQGRSGAAFIRMSDVDLQESKKRLLGTEAARKLMSLIELSEEWHLKLSDSSDLKTSVVMESDVVAGTCVGFCREPAAAKVDYDLCIVDEASKATSPELLVPMSKAKKVVLVGDHHQLPAVVDYALRDESLLEEYDLDERLLKKQLFEQLVEELNEGQKAKLLTQFRMAPEIGSLVSECFYDRELKNAEELLDRPRLDLELAGIMSPVTWVDIRPRQDRRRRDKRIGTSWKNETEVQAICTFLRRIAFVAKSGGVPSDLSIAVIAAHGAQVRLIERHIAADSEIAWLKIEVNTVHQFQGRQVDICFYSVTRDNPGGSIGFLDDWRLLNVALSRAKQNVVIVGSLEFCRVIDGENPFYNVIRYIDEALPGSGQEWAGV